MRRAALALAALAVTAVLAVVVGWFADGGRWYVVRTPSMGAAAPVGTLLWVHPAPASDLHRGDVITFRPPGERAVYSHRIHAIAPDGTLTTKGDLTSPDPWRLHSADVLGRVAARWWGVGWLVRAAPLLLAAVVLLVLGSRRLSIERRRPVLVLGAALACSLALVVFHPLAGVEALGPSSAGHATYVSTGLLPLRLDTQGTAATLRPGHAVTLHARTGTVTASASPEFAWWGWALLVLGCLTPAAVTTMRNRRVRPVSFGYTGLVVVGAAGSPVLGESARSPRWWPG